MLWSKPRPRTTVYLKKANDSVISHCKCIGALITFPPQMDCPWCGCGWLFTCVECRKAFTFAVGVALDEPLEAIGRRDLRNRGEEPSDADVRDWVAAMRELIHEVKPGELYVCIDGRIIPAGTEQIAFDGWAARHDLSRPPQVLAINDPQILRHTLSDPEYWKKRWLSE